MAHAHPDREAGLKLIGSIWKLAADAKYGFKDVQLRTERQVCLIIQSRNRFKSCLIRPATEMKS